MSEGLVTFCELFISQDIDKCVAIMCDLDSLALTQMVLKKNPDVVATIKKVRIS